MEGICPGKTPIGSCLVTGLPENFKFHMWLALYFYWTSSLFLRKRQGNYLPKYLA